MSESKRIFSEDVFPYVSQIGRFPDPPPPSFFGLKSVKGWDMWTHQHSATVTIVVFNCWLHFGGVINKNVIFPCFLTSLGAIFQNFGEFPRHETPFLIEKYCQFALAGYRQVLSITSKQSGCRLAHSFAMGRLSWQLANGSNIEKILTLRFSPLLPVTRICGWWDGGCGEGLGSTW